jgi:hypothetical protein
MAGLVRPGTPRRIAVTAAAALVTSALLVSPMRPASATTAANPVVTWDLNAQTAIWDVAGQQPYVTGRSFAMVNGAVYDAVNAIAGTPYEPYLAAPVATGRESTDAAVATAAYRVLASLFPAQVERLQAQYTAAIDPLPNGPAKRGGIAIGARTAAAMIAARQGDGAFGNQTWTPGTQPGQWRPTPPLFGSDGAWVGHVKPFLIPSGSMFRTAGPPALTSAAYANEVNEVKLIGSASSTVRTPDQTQSAIWWHDRRSTEWEIKRQLATTQQLTPLETARMFAMVDLISTDAGIACFKEKEAWNFWRPITAIRLADTDGNPATAPDPGWTSLLITPPFPDYTSGHACGTGARMSTMAAYFKRDRVSFSAYSVDSGTTRHFDSFSQAVTELIGARVWGGVHFRTADVQGVKIGVEATLYGTTHYFRPRR